MLEKIDNIPLAQLTPGAVLAWQNRFTTAVRTPEERGHAAVTVNSIIRNAKALLSKKSRPFVEQELQLPSPLFFEGITKEEVPGLSYSSTIDAGTILRNAQIDLVSTHPESYKLLLLTLVCGLRRSEADTLLWSQFNFQKRLPVIKDTEYKRLKSRDSGGEIDLEPQVCALFQGYHAKSLGPFVLEQSTRTRIPAVQASKRRGYRCDQTHKNLVAWLRKQGVKGLRPIHMMRKEIGSIIASRDGIWKASRYLRHSEIGITSRIYADKKDRVTSGLASFLDSTGPAPEPANASAQAGGEAGIQ